MEQASSTELTASVELNVSLARPVIAVLRVLRFVIGRRRAGRLAEFAVLRLARWRVHGQRHWQWLGPATRSAARRAARAASP